LGIANTSALRPGVGFLPIRKMIGQPVTRVFSSFTGIRETHMVGIRLGAAVTAALAYAGSVTAPAPTTIGHWRPRSRVEPLLFFAGPLAGISTV